MLNHVKSLAFLGQCWLNPPFRPKFQVRYQNPWREPVPIWVRVSCSFFSIQVASEWWLEIEHPTEYSWTSNVLTKWKCAHSREESTRYPLPVRRGWRGWKLKCFKKGVVTPPDIFQLYKNVWLVIKNPTHFDCFFFPHASWNFWGEEVQNPQKFRYSSRIAFLGIFKDPGHEFARVIWFAFWSIQLTYLC